MNKNEDTYFSLDRNDMFLWMNFSALSVCNILVGIPRKSKYTKPLVSTAGQFRVCASYHKIGCVLPTQEDAEEECLVSKTRSLRSGSTPCRLLLQLQLHKTLN